MTKYLSCYRAPKGVRFVVGSARQDELLELETRCGEVFPVGEETIWEPSKLEPLPGIWIGFADVDGEFEPAVVWSSEGFIYDCLQQTSEADTTVGSDLLGSESTQPSSSHFFRVCLFATMGRGRRR